MPKLPKALKHQLEQRLRNNSLRRIQHFDQTLIDFASNDYLGLGREVSVEVNATSILNQYPVKAKPGSRLLTGNTKIHEDCEAYLAQLYHAETSLLYNSGYSANLGLISAVGLRTSLILYDELVHASIRDGISLAQAKAYKFKHNNIKGLKDKLSKFSSQYNSVFVITESVFSMDGDQAPVDQISNLCQQFEAHLILDEAHAIGVMGAVGLSHNTINCFARVITFGKSLAQHGAIVLGSLELKSYLVNFSRSFIYTTAMSTHQVALIWSAHQALQDQTELVKRLQSNIKFFRNQLQELATYFIKSESAIQSCIVSDNTKCKAIAQIIQHKGFDVRPILSPTVPLHRERLRFCLHAFNSAKEIKEVLELLKTQLVSN